MMRLSCCHFEVRSLVECERTAVQRWIQLLAGGEGGRMEEKGKTIDT
jgi:hypothetical protein